MNHEQLAYLHQQLAGMLRSGIPLEGALQQLCRDLQRGALRGELEALQADLSRGIPLAEAIEARRLPELHRRLIALGARSDDLPGVLTLLGDYSQRMQLLWTRLKGLLAYPVMVLAAGTALAILAAQMGNALTQGTDSAVVVLFDGRASAEAARLTHGMWVLPVLLGMATVLALMVVAIPACRRWLRWQLPGLKDGALAQLASAFHVLLLKGCPLGDAVALVRQVEGTSAAGAELGEWHRRIAAGQGKPADFAAGSTVIPPLFRWLVAQGGEDLAAGFRRAADLYLARATYRLDLWLRLALPLAVVFLGLLILVELLPVVRLLTMQIDALGDMSSGL